MYKNNGQDLLKTMIINFLLKKLYSWGVTTHHNLLSYKFMIRSPVKLFSVSGFVRFITEPLFLPQILSLFSIIVTETTHLGADIVTKTSLVPWGLSFTAGSLPATAVVRNCGSQRQSSVLRKGTISSKVIQV